MNQQVFLSSTSHQLPQKLKAGSTSACVSPAERHKKEDKKKKRKAHRLALSNFRADQLTVLAVFEKTERADIHVEIITHSQEQKQNKKNFHPTITVLFVRLWSQSSSSITHKAESQQVASMEDSPHKWSLLICSSCQRFYTMGYIYIHIKKKKKN